MYPRLSVRDYTCCFETTDWDALCGTHGVDIDSLAHCITDYINLYVDNIVPSKREQCFSNKPWVTPDLKNLLNLKKSFHVRLQGGTTAGQERGEVED